MATDPRRQEQARTWGQVVARAWSDEAFKRRLLAEPGAVLGEQGLELRAGVEVRVVENTAEVVHLVLPAPPEGELSEEQLDRAAGGNACLSGLCTPGP